MKREHDILCPFLEFLYSLTPEQRLWIMDKYHKYFCGVCGEDVAESCKHMDDRE